MNWIIRYDQWIFHRLEVLLLWLEEWFSISQKCVEQSMIVLYIVLCLVHSFWYLDLILVKIICSFSVAYLMWNMHQRPATVRKCMQKYQPNSYYRISLQVVFGSLVVFILFQPPHQWTNVSQALAQILFVVFFYVVDITSNGEPGRRRKMALAELKKMFGLEWIPKPVLVP
jgi:hypothetical protein